MPKGDHLAEFELFVMLAIARLGDDRAYGVTIRQEIEGRTGRHVAIGAVYATLGRLHDKGFLSFRYSDPEPVQGGRARKLVSLSRAGRQALIRSATSLARMSEGLSLLPSPGARR
jgi:DNA-binding PadR family transcriptional regulator